MLQSVNGHVMRRRGPVRLLWETPACDWLLAEVLAEVSQSAGLARQWPCITWPLKGSGARLDIGCTASDAKGGKDKWRRGMVERWMNRKEGEDGRRFRWKIKSWLDRAPGVFPYTLTDQRKGIIIMQIARLCFRIQMFWWVWLGDTVGTIWENNSCSIIRLIDILSFKHFVMDTTI